MKEESETKLLGDLSKVNSELARKILDFIPAPPSPMKIRELAPPPKCERVKKEIKDYENAVNQALKDLRTKFVMDLALVVITILILVLAVIFSNLNGILTSIGLTGTSAYAQAKTAPDTFKAYINDRAKLRNSVNDVNMSYDGCASDDEACCQKVEDAVKQYMKDLTQASTLGK